ncbi:hypothetical protein KVR01_001971 [Diaporthe batatas]|uniref:uncharacterized protein n=1 Tax=Diaporthe batatas TaxID=748121 RepID=UPI001D04B731|nr:uncharacterized protein KVR01_001971 [Diaporthe batatas]KAG8169222.1 hypothetical protein KVR01_001971 [Diaporthe batatas]
MDDPRWTATAPPEQLEACRASDILDVNHQDVFATAMSNLLSTDIAEQTFAQIIDGLPLKDVAFNLEATQYTRRDPVFTHVELCPGVLEKARMFRDSFDPRAMELRTDVLQRYQDVPARSRASKLPLLELVAVAVHTIAAELFDLDGALHKRDTPCTRYTGNESDAVSRLPPWPTVFAVYSYTDPARFPRGISDIAGYWAEDIIFGGVVLFGRGESGTGYDGIWFDSHREGVTFRIYALTEEQIESLLHFLEWEPKSQPSQQEQRPECPLPILGNDTNLTRVDPDVAIPLHNVYRDRWEKPAFWGSYGAYSFRKSGPRDELNWPEIKLRKIHTRPTRSQGGTHETFGELLAKVQEKNKKPGSGSGT